MEKRKENHLTKVFEEKGRIRTYFHASSANTPLTDLDNLSKSVILDLKISLLKDKNSTKKVLLKSLLDPFLNFYINRFLKKYLTKLHVVLFSDYSVLMRDDSGTRELA